MSNRLLVGLVVMAALAPLVCPGQTTVTSTFDGVYYHFEDHSTNCYLDKPANWVSTGTGLQLDSSFTCGDGSKAAVHINIGISTPTMTGIVFSDPNFRNGFYLSSRPFRPT